ncbi:MAG: MoaD/ThiS family protein [Polaribacter sp.]|jgi:molybdopterin converting factor subunit 1|uniref:MoaD/ThiS family protein n=1 Tax=Polaribacter sp. TaxID=1920175 RepID=UPI00384E7FE4|tara:strand:- start:153 stop:395 length:243 start_codon:yes stop_codon:yes gene_type:complete
MKITLLFFGVTADLIGKTVLVMALENTMTVGALKLVLKEKYLKLKNIDTYAVAVNEAYAEGTLVLKEGDVVAIIPPVSGG